MVGELPAAQYGAQAPPGAMVAARAAGEMLPVHSSLSKGLYPAAGHIQL